MDGSYTCWFPLKHIIRITSRFVMKVLTQDDSEGNGACIKLEFSSLVVENQPQELTSDSTPVLWHTCVLKHACVYAPTCAK